MMLGNETRSNFTTPMVLTSLLAAALYLATAVLLVLRLVDRAPAVMVSKQRILFLGLLAVALHGAAVLQSLYAQPGVDVSFFSVLSLVMWLVALLLLLFALRAPVENLAILILPLSASAVVMRLLSEQHSYLPSNTPWGLEIHILLSIFAYSMLTIAVVQAILLSIQESHLHNRHPGGFIRMLPPLQTMEHLLFQMIGLGFGLLSLGLVTGAFFVDDLFAQQLVHKTVLSIIAWLLFGTLLFGRWQWGWRGRTAIRWTVSGFVFLLLAYFGSKFVIELIIQR